MGYAKVEWLIRNRKSAVFSLTILFLRKYSCAHIRVYSFYRPPGCSCPKGFAGDHCEYLEGKEPGAKPSGGGSVPSGEGSVVDKGLPESNQSSVDTTMSSVDRTLIGVGISLGCLAIFTGTIILVVAWRGGKDSSFKDVDNNIISPMEEGDFVGDDSTAASSNAKSGQIMLETVEIL
jgi:hypothetical protein